MGHIESKHAYFAFKQQRFRLHFLGTIKTVIFPGVAIRSNL